MKGFMGCCAALILMLCLTGCTNSALGDRVMVKAIYLEHEETFEARLLVLQSAPSADTGQVSEQARYLKGSGDTVYAALQSAEQSENRSLFYGQNELLLLGPKLARQGAFEACRYMAGETSGRPNMAVYGLDIGPDAFEAMQQKGTDFLSSVQQLEKHALYRTYLYQFAQPEQNGVIPMLSVRENAASPAGLTLYENGSPAASWQGAQAQLAALLAGQANALELELPSLPVSFQVRSPKLAFEPGLAKGGLQLTIRFSGAIQKLTGPQGAAVPGQTGELEQAIDREITRLLAGLAADTLGRGNDVFHLGSYFANYSEPAYRAMQADGRLGQARRVKFVCRLRMV